MIFTERIYQHEEMLISDFPLDPLFQTELGQIFDKVFLLMENPPNNS